MGFVMKRVISFVKNNYIIILSFLTTFFIYFLSAFVNKIYPFGTKTFIYSDMFEQYISYFNYVRDAILHGETLFSSFSFTLGQNFYGILTYFCLSPLNLLFLLGTKANLPTFVLLIVTLKLALSSMSMAILLRTKLKNKFVIFIFSVIYSLMTYNLTYSTNVMWLDVVYLLPLIILGLERLEEKPMLYLITLTIAICSNYYISFPVCIFLVIYFIYYTISNKTNFKKILFNFIKYSIIAALLSSVVLIPTVFNMLSGKFETTPADFSFDIIYNPYYLIYKFLVSDFKVLLTDMPHITSSLLVLVLTVLYLFSKNVTIKDKITTYGTITVLILITMFPFTDTIMHCFRLPNLFTCRYAFIISFFLILTASKCLDKSEFNKKNFLIYLVIGYILYMYLSLYLDFKIVVSVILFIAYFIAAMFIKKKWIQAILIIPLVIGELGINISADFSWAKREKYESYKKLMIYEEDINKLKPDQNSFYRISGIDRITHNDSIAYKYYGITSFSPTISVNSNKLLKEYFGFPLKASYVIENVSTTAFTDSLLNVKYKYKTTEGFEYFENEFVFPVMFKMKENDYFKQADVLIETQNNLYKYLSNSDDRLFELSDDYKIDGCEYKDDTIIPGKIGCCTFSNEDKDNYYYIEVKDLKMVIMPLYDGINTNNWYGENFILKMNYHSRFFTSEKPLKIDYLYVYKMDKEKLAHLAAKLNENGINITSHSQNKITGTISNDEDDQIMFTSIPYDKGWHAYINGEEVETFKNLDSLLAFKLPKGELNVEIVFIPQGFNIGLFISLLTLDLLFILKVRKKSKEN